jgi:hypothetical protein
VFQATGSINYIFNGIVPKEFSAFPAVDASLTLQDAFVPQSLINSLSEVTRCNSFVLQNVQNFTNLDALAQVAQVASQIGIENYYLCANAAERNCHIVGIAHHL